MEVEGHGRRPPQSVLVEVTPAEVEMCFEFARRCSSLRAYSGAHGWRGGLVAGMRLFGGIYADRTHCGMTVGKVGELAMCKLAGAHIDLALRDRGDGGRDLRLPCGSVQVKTSRRSYPTRMVRDPVEACDWFVFATWSGLSRTVSVEGYVSREVLSRRPSVWAPSREWMNKEMSVHGLLPIRQLLRIRPISEVM